MVLAAAVREAAMKATLEAVRDERDRLLTARIFASHAASGAVSSARGRPARN